MANGFSGHAKTQSMEPGQQIFVDRDRCPVQVCLGCAYQIQKQSRDDPGLTRIYQQASPRQPLRVQTDQGKEFYNRGVQAWFKKLGTHHFSTYGDSKASVVERWHRTLKQRMYRYFTAHNTLRYVDVLQPLIHTYNHAYHRSIGMAPHQVTPSTVPEVWERLYGPRLNQKTSPPKCRVGDRVRLNKKHRPFKKGYLPGWTEEVFVVTHVRRHPVVTY